MTLSIFAETGQWHPSTVSAAPETIHGDIHDIMNIRHLESARFVPPGMPKSVLTQNQHLAPSTQQAEQSWLNTCAGSEACQSIFLKTDKG
jgi:hypothetical protein